MSEEIESLEVRLERAWCQLKEMHPSTERALFLTPRGAIVGFKDSQGRPPNSILMGIFTREEDLQHFRETVFFVWSEMQRASCGPR